MKETIKVYEDSKVRIGTEEFTETTANNEVKSKGSCGRSLDKTTEDQHYSIEMSWEEAQKWVDGNTGTYIPFTDLSLYIPGFQIEVEMAMTKNALICKSTSFRLEFDRHHISKILFYGIYKELGYLLSFKYCSNSALNVAMNLYSHVN